MDIRGAFGALTKPFRKPEGYVSAKDEQAAVAPAPTPTPAPVAAAPRLGGVNLDATKRREAAAGLKDGGKVHGKGTGTSDSIPANLSKGEYVLPADTTKALGTKALDAIVDATHTYVPEHSGGMANGGKVCRAGAKRKGYVNGKLVREEDRLPAPLTRADAERAWKTVAPPPAAPAPPSAVRAVVGGAMDDAGAAASQGRYGAAAADLVRGAAALPVAVASNAVAPLVNSVTDFAGSLAGGSANGSATAPRLGAQRPATATVGNAAAPPGAPVTVNPRDQRMATESAGVAVDGAPGVLRMTSPGATAYTNVPGATIQGERAGVISPQNDAAMTALSNRSRVESLVATYGADAARAMLSGQPAPAPVDPRALVLDKMKSAADRNAPLTAKGARVLVDLAGQDVQRTSERDRTAVDRRRVGVTEAESVPRIGVARQQLSDAQNLSRLQGEYAAAKDESTRKTLREQILLAQGKEAANRYTVIPGGQGVDPTTGQVVREPSQVLDNQTGQLVNTGAAAKPAAMPPKDKLVKGQTYPTPRGPARWDGTKFIPV